MHICIYDICIISEYHVRVHHKTAKNETGKTEIKSSRFETGSSEAEWQLVAGSGFTERVVLRGGEKNFQPSLSSYEAGSWETVAGNSFQTESKKVCARLLASSSITASSERCLNLPNSRDSFFFRMCNTS